MNAQKFFGEALMLGEAVQQRLAASSAIDEVGARHLISAIEKETFARPWAFRAGSIYPNFVRHEHPTVTLMGDGALVEVTSVIDAVRCAVDSQSGIEGYEAEALDA